MLVPTQRGHTGVAHELQGLGARNVKRSLPCHSHMTTAISSILCENVLPSCGTDRAIQCKASRTATDVTTQSHTESHRPPLTHTQRTPSAQRARLKQSPDRSTDRGRRPLALPLHALHLAPGSSPTHRTYQPTQANNAQAYSRRLLLAASLCPAIHACDRLPARCRARSITHPSLISPISALQPAHAPQP